MSGIKAALHPWVDPVLSLPDHWRARRALAGLADGLYQVGVDVPYYPQFASPDRIYDYIHGGYDGTRDPEWHRFGAEEPAEYAFWAPRVCALACLKMAVEAFHPQTQPSLWQIVQEGLALKGYTVRDDRGKWVDQGWYVQAQIELAARHGLQAVGRAYASPLSICRYIREGWLAAATVTPELGERQPGKGRYGGHLVLIYGFRWQHNRPDAYYLHNPSGRFPELQAHAEIPAARFHPAFAHRLITFRSVSA